MNGGRKAELADLLREYRRQLERALTELAGRDGPFTSSDARRIIETTDERLVPIEAALGPTHHRLTLLLARVPFLLAFARWVRQFLRRLRGLSRPRIGQLDQYPPRPLLVPASYSRVELPAAPPTISVVTPSFQQARFIERTIESVLSQRYPALEYVVQDGASTDGTVAILERFADSLTRWTSVPDGGHADALNRGFSLTNGEIMGWLNSDDLLLPSALRCVGSYFAAHPDVDVVYGNRLLIDEHDGEIGAWILPGHDDLALTLADFVPQETMFWRRRIWDRVGGYLDESFGYALDWDLLLRFRDAGARMVRLPRFLGAFRVHREQRTSADRTRGLEEMSRLRERVWGRPLSNDEIRARLRPYLRRHVVVHLRQRFSDRLPYGRVAVIDPARRELVESHEVVARL
jgi:glycosyltransferase involved in cell wall biosynthesis